MSSRITVDGDVDIKALQWLRTVGVRRYTVPPSIFSSVSAAESPPSPPRVSVQTTEAENEESEDAAAAFFPFSGEPLSLSSATVALDSSLPNRSAALFEPPSPRPRPPGRSLQVVCAGPHATTDRYPGDLTGLHVWPISAFLCSFLSFHPTLLRARDLLEVGCGPGLVGLFAAHSASRVVLSDTSENALRLCRLSAALNGVKKRVRVARLAWGEDDVSLLAELPDGFPVILGSDCMYKLSTLDALFETVDALLSRPPLISSAPPVFVHAYQPRFEAVTSHLLTVCRRYHFALFVASDAASTARQTARQQRLHGVLAWRVDEAEELVALDRPTIQLFVRDDSYTWK